MTATPEELFSALVRELEGDRDRVIDVLLAIKDAGWQLVPKEATEEMNYAGKTAMGRAITPDNGAIAWRRMLEDAPKVWP